ncbi:MAG: winged helix-turn-helix transcriptional regulator [Alphaproteobacteria bacterium]
MHKKILVNCEIEVTIRMIGGKYKAMILYFLANEKIMRFGEIKANIKHISQKTLTNQLRELEEDDLVLRKVYPEVPPKVEYSLTKKGKSLIEILEKMCDWGAEYADERFELINPQCKG